MKILLINDYGVPAGGAECIILSLRDELRHRVTAISRTGGLAEIVRDGITGRLVKPGDVDGLAAALLGILADRETVTSMGKAAHADARERFDLPGFAARFEAI